MKFRRRLDPLLNDIARWIHPYREDQLLLQRDGRLWLWQRHSGSWMRIGGRETIDTAGATAMAYGFVRQVPEV